MITAGQRNRQRVRRVKYRISAKDSARRRKEWQSPSSKRDARRARGMA